MKRLALGLAALLLAGCMLNLPGGKDAAKTVGPNPITGGTVSTTVLAPPGAGTKGAALAAGPAAADVTAAEAKGATPAPPPAPPPAPLAEPETPPSPQSQACAKEGGQWSRVGKAGFACVQSTRDAGKACTRGTQCEGNCLARSGTCAPITPMFGCNDILQDDGSRATLCID